MYALASDMGESKGPEDVFRALFFCFVLLGNSYRGAIGEMDEGGVATRRENKADDEKWMRRRLIRPKQARCGR